MMVKQRMGKSFIATCLVATMLLGNTFTMPVYAEEESVANTMQSIKAVAGNSEMKTYGESIGSGTIPTVTDEDTPDGTGTTYYVDAENGSNANGGTTKDTAWKDFEPINVKEFSAGDRILLKAGCEWSNTTLHPLGSGTAENPIVLSSYGEGNMPNLSGNAQVEDVVYLYNQQYWDISNLDISNTAAALLGVSSISVNDTNGSALSDVRGLHVTGQDGGQLSGFDVHNLYIHDVTGEDCWISGTYDATTPGITKGTGWDKSKRTGAIIFDILQPQVADAQPTSFHDVTIEKNALIDNSFGGIIFKQWKGDKVDDSEPGADVNWANGDDTLKQPAYASGDWNPHTDIVVQDNFLSHAGSEYACDTIYLTSVQGAVIQRNVSKEAGTSAIELYYADDVSIQYNEVYGVRAKAGGADSNAIDPDKKATNVIIQYNYTHETGDGILLCGFIYGTSVVRYNVVQDAEKRYVNPHGDKGYNYVYNNIFYNTYNVSTVTFVNSSGGPSYLGNTSNMHYFSNNIFYNAASDTSSAVLAEGNGIDYSNNCYYGNGVNNVSGDENGIYANPQFTNSTGPSSIEELSNFALPESSPLINGGIDMDAKLGAAGFVFTNAALGTTDLFGNSLYNDEPDIGITEFEGIQGAGTIHGYVSDEYGYKIAGATVTLNGTTTIQTDENGYYAFASVAEGSCTLTASMNEYENGATETVDVASTKVISKNLTLGASLAMTGTISGMVKNAGGGIAGVTVTLNDTTTTQTDGSGAFSFSNVPVNIDTGYTIKAEKTGYTAVTKENVLVRPANITTLELVMSKDISSTLYKINENFNNYTTGAFAGNDKFSVYNSVSANTISVVDDSTVAGNKYMQLLKTTSGSMALYNATAQNLTGTVTIEARVKRTVSGGTANQMGMYSFNTADWTKADPTGNSNSIATFAYSKGNIITHNVKGASTTVNVKAYTVDQWDIIRNVVNIDTGTFDIYINDMTTPVLSNQPLRTQGKNLDYFNFFSSSTNTGDICIDYFRVCQGAPYNYNDASLLALSADNAEIKSTGDTTYEASVDAQTTSIRLTPSIGFGSCTIGGIAYDGTNPVEVELNAGENTIPLVVTAEDGVTTKSYMLEVVREDPMILAYLTSLGIDGVELTPIFDKDTEEYSASVAADIDHISFNYDKVLEACTIEAKANNNTCDLSNVALKEGDNLIYITVGSQDGTNFKTYKITVTRSEAEPVITKHQVNFESNGGSAVASQTITEGEKATEPTAPTKAGYTFAGWYKDSACTTVWNFTADTVTFDTILYAKWSINETPAQPILVTGITLSKSSVIVGTQTTTELKATVSPLNAANTGLIWSSSDNNIARVNENGLVTANNRGTATITATAADESKVFTSCEVVVGYKITYVLNGGTNHEDNPTGFTGKSTVKILNPVKNGYTFKGWYIDKKFKTKITKISKNTKKNITVYAKWEKITVEKAKIDSLKNSGKGKMKVTVEKVNGAKGYEIVYATNKKLNSDVKTITTTSKTKTLSNLTKGKTYYVKVRAYIVDASGNKIYGKYSGVSKVKITK